MPNPIFEHQPGHDAQRAAERMTARSGAQPSANAFAKAPATTQASIQGPTSAAPIQHISKLLVANRGEIAFRVVRTAQEMGIFTVVVYAEQDRHSPYVAMADEAYLLSGDTYADTYLNEDLLIDILKRSGADAVHPGYGFLSEVASFAQKVLDAGAIWIGPNPAALNSLGDKISARRVALMAKVPPVPGISHSVGEMRVLLDFAHTHGYPIMMKRTDGGGGRGITLVRSDDELRSFYLNHNAVQGGDLNEYFVERFIDNGRHVETQCGRDSHGNFTVYSTRDCSVQRRNQKLIEEAPAPFLADEVEQQLENYSRRLFESVGYVGLGTCEFMVTDTDKAYFLEVNPRLQVEHTVSEEVSGVDLVREQLNIANGEPLTVPTTPRGHSFELRITSEDPQKNLTPSAGTLERIEWPSGPGIRVDCAVTQGDTISPKFDSMMGKLVVSAQDRETAVARVRRALKELVVEGIPTPVSLYQQVFADREFTAERGAAYAVNTKWFERKYLNREASTVRGGQPTSVSALAASEPERESSASFVIELNNKRVEVNVPSDVASLFVAGGRARGAHLPTQPLRGQGMHHVQKAERKSERSGEIAAPMQAIVTRINVQEGQDVEKGDLLVVLESMKMENYVYAPVRGIVKEIAVEPATGVDAGEILLTIDVEGAHKDTESGAEKSGSGNGELRGAEKENGGKSSRYSTDTPGSSVKSANNFEKRDEK